MTDEMKKYILDRGMDPSMFPCGDDTETTRGNTMEDGGVHTRIIKDGKEMTVGELWEDGYSLGAKAGYERALMDLRRDVNIKLEYGKTKD